MLLKTLLCGRNTSQIQFETAQKMRSVISNFVHMTPAGVGISTVGTGDQGGQFFSGSPTNSVWFCRFMIGCHRCMGDVWLPDHAISTDEVLEGLQVLQDEYRVLQSGHRRLEVCLTASLLIVGFTAALRGEKIRQIDIGMIRKYWKEAKEYRHKPHVPLALVGRLKQTAGTIRVFIQPLAPITSSGIQVALWLGRTIEEFNVMGVTTGPMFRVSTPSGSVKRATISHLDSLFHDIMKRVQFHRPDLVAP